jgi:hypothetical protein
MFTAFSLAPAANNLLKNTVFHELDSHQRAGFIPIFSDKIVDEPPHPTYPEA